MSTISSLTARKNTLIADATDLVNGGLNTPERKEQNRALLAEIDSIQTRIDGLYQIERAMPSIKAAPVHVSPAPVVGTLEERRAKLNSAFRHMLKNGYSPIAPEQRDITTSNGAALIPQEFDEVYTSALKYYGPIGTLVKQDRNTNGRPHKFTVSDDTAGTLTLVAEDTSTVGLEVDPSFQSKVPGTDSLATIVKFSLQMLEDSFSLEAFIRDIAGIRVARSVEYALTLGKDNATSNTALPNSPAGGLLANAPQGAVTSTLAAGIGYSDLVNLASSVDHAYWVNGAYMASPSVFNYFVGQKDSTGRPYYNFDPVTGLLQIAGKLLYVNNAMPAYNAASSPAVLFGDFSRAYVYQTAGLQIRVLKERFIDSFEGAAVIYHRLGAATLVSGAVKSLVTAAS